MYYHAYQNQGIDPEDESTWNRPAPTFENVYQIYENSEKKYEILYLSGKDFIFSDADIKADEEERQHLIEKENYDSLTDDIVHTFLDDLLNAFYNDEQFVNLCLVLEDVGKSNFAEELYDRLGKYMCMYSCYDDFPSLFVILFEQDDSAVPSILRRYLRLIRMSPPNKNQRQRLLVNCGISKDLAEPIANATEGFNYAQLSDLARNIVLYQFTYETISSEVCMNMINTQSPVQAVDEYDGFNAEKISLYKKN